MRRPAAPCPRTVTALAAISTVVAAGAVALATATPAVAAGTRCYDGSYTVPAGVYALSVTAIGGSGTTGDGKTNAFFVYHGGGVGGAGAKVSARYAAVTPGQVLYYGANSPTVAGGVVGPGYGNTLGGRGGNGSFVSTAAPTEGTPTGKPGTITPCLLDQSAFLVVAGGGGGGGAGAPGGPGGTGGQAGAAGNAGSDAGSGAGGGGVGGTLTAGGAGGRRGEYYDTGSIPWHYVYGYAGSAGAAAGAGTTGGLAAPQDASLGASGGLASNGGAGGGGYFGGGGGGSDGGDGGGGGGGGSSYVAPSLFANVVATTTTDTPAVTFTPLQQNTLSLTAGPNPAVSGQPVTFTLKSGSPTATGTVKFFEGGVQFGATAGVAMRGGQATLATTFTANDPSKSIFHDVYATYSGDDANLGTDIVGTPTVTVEVHTAPSVTSDGQPVAVTKPYGTAAPFAVTTAGFPQPSVQWQISRDNGGSWNNLTEGTGRTLSYVGHVRDSGSLVRAVLTNDAGTATSQPAKVTITPAPLTITGSSSTVAYGDSPAVAAVYNGLTNSDTADSLKTPPATAPTLACTTTARTGSPVGTYPTTCSGASSPDYAITYAAGTVVVARTALTVTASSASTTYGGAVPAVTSTITGFRNGQSSDVLTTPPTCSTTAGATSHAGAYPTTCSGGAAANYAFTYVPGQVTIGQAALTVTASDATSTYGAATPTVTPSYAGFLGGDTAAALTTAPTCAAASTATSAVGTYATACSGATSGDYAIGYVAGKASVTPAPLTITAAGATSVYGGATPATSARYSGFVNGEDVRSLTTAPTCTVATSATTPAGTYPAAATCRGAASGNYTIGYLAGTATVQRAPLTITAADGTSVYGAAAPAITPRYSGFVNGEDARALTTAPTCTAGTTAGTDAGTYPNRSTCTGAAAANYDLRYVAGTVTVTRATLTGTAAPVSFLTSVLAGRITVSARFVNATTTAPAAGVPVTFTAVGLLGRVLTCTATTDATGTATCALPSTLGAPVIPSGSYTAAAAATGNYVGVTVKGTIRLLG